MSERQTQDVRSVKANKVPLQWRVALHIIPEGINNTFELKPLHDDYFFKCNEQLVHYVNPIFNRGYGYQFQLKLS